MMDTTGLRLSLGFVLRHCMNITWTSVQSLWRQPLQASASRSPLSNHTTPLSNIARTEILGKDQTDLPQWN